MQLVDKESNILYDSPLIMLVVNKGTKKLDDKKQAVVTTSFSEKELFTTEEVTTSDEVHKRTDNI